MWTKAEIREKLETNDKWLIRGLIAIYQYQTAEEQAMDATLADNGVGFNGADAEFLSSLARQAEERGFLTPKQIAAGRKKMLKYAGQLARIANEKNTAEAA